MDDRRDRELNRLRNQLTMLTSDLLEEWIRDYADTLSDAQKAAKLAVIANEMMADRRKLRKRIEAAIALLED
jgi:hypothetical protein